MKMGRLFPSVVLFCKRCLWVVSNHVINTNFKRGCLLAFVGIFVLWCLISGGIDTVGRYSKWTPASLVTKPNSGKHFVLTREDDIYMYSAIANTHHPVNDAVNIIITTLANSRASLDCCVLVDGGTIFVTPAEEYFQYHSLDVAFIGHFVELFQQQLYYARQYTCVVPEIGDSPHHVTLTSSECSPDIKDYLPILYPPQVPGGLALCAKTAFGGKLEPEKVIEWFEVQQLLGVDKIVLFDLGNTENMTRVFRYYQNLGLLDLQPYELPGFPKNRTLTDYHHPQFHQDESLPVLECRQRMAGYTYVMSHDLDEFIIPRRDITLKQFLREQMEIYQDSAAFYFDAEFFVYEWGPTNPEDDLMVTRYRKATKPHWECTKYIYLPPRVISCTTHTAHTLSPWKTYRLPSDKAVIHHYRACPHVWDTCYPETIIDHIMTRYTDLHQRVKKVREATKNYPTWKIERN